MFPTEGGEGGQRVRRPENDLNAESRKGVLVARGHDRTNHSIWTDRSRFFVESLERKSRPRARPRAHSYHATSKQPEYGA